MAKSRGGGGRGGGGRGGGGRGGDARRSPEFSRAVERTSAISSEVDALRSQLVNPQRRFGRNITPEQLAATNRQNNQIRSKITKLNKERQKLIDYTNGVIRAERGG